MTPTPATTAGIALLHRWDQPQPSYESVRDAILAIEREASASAGALDLGDEQARNLAELLASRQQTLSEWLSDVLMEMGLGRTPGKEYLVPIASQPAAAEPPLREVLDNARLYRKEIYVEPPAAGSAEPRWPDVDCRDTGRHYHGHPAPTDGPFDGPHPRPEPTLRSGNAGDPYPL